MLAATDDGISSLWAETVLGGSGGTNNPTLTTVLADPQGSTIAKYLPNVPLSELGNETYFYDNDNDTTAEGASSYHHIGANIVIYNTTYEHRQMLDAIIDNSDGGNAGKIGFDPTDTGTASLFYKIAPNPSSF